MVGAVKKRGTTTLTQMRRWQESLKRIRRRDNKKLSKRQGKSIQREISKGQSANIRRWKPVWLMQGVDRRPVWLDGG